MHETIRRYDIPNEIGTFSIRLPEHSRLLGVHANMLLVLGVHDDERLVDKRFVAVGEGEVTISVSGHGFIGVCTRENAPGFGLWHQYVFTITDPAPLSDFLGRIPNDYPHP